ncbi:PIG-L deacetylase family protein [Shewanella woodyi]|uniref:LmbE family protein n=1 Tax=Shewanella woodyi (strain ATCC 51908 / MS32) TaxID=392500 RepID=B1KLE4_SHEWM|nr:PIG-L deacetylase family protein [Shewanella woodyi]ACA85869.1 LmbE family protein [Shewanella woodyi ATCC 51908]
MKTKKVLVIAPHADDESLGCGGTILKHIDIGDEVHWLIVTGMSLDSGFSEEQINIRKDEIAKVGLLYKFKQVHELFLPPASLDCLPKKNIISAISSVIQSVEPELIYTAYRNDAHSDHEVVFDAITASSKTFRYPSIKRILAYETLSETDFGLKPEDGGFKPNVFVDISDFLEQKLNILDHFESEMSHFPFPRSRKAISSLSFVRGVQAGCESAEAFMLLKEIIR